MLIPKTGHGAKGLNLGCALKHFNGDLEYGRGGGAIVIERRGYVKFSMFGSCWFFPAKLLLI